MRIIRVILTLVLVGGCIPAEMNFFPGSQAINRRRVSLNSDSFTTTTQVTTTTNPTVTTPTTTTTTTTTLPSQTGPSFINTNSRQSVVDAYHNWYNKPQPSIAWTGDIASCTAGTTSVAFQQRVIEQINFYRAMVGLSPAELVANNTSAQEAALMMQVNNRLSHSPAETWQCYSSTGRGGAGSSNLALGAYGKRAIDLYINDPGANNGAVGHRRWILYPPRKQFATGDTPRANALKVFLGSGNPRNVDYVPWPSEGYFPYRLLPGSRRWSFSKAGAGFSNATVEMQNLTTGEQYSVTLESLRSGYGDNTLVWKPSGLSTSRPSQDTTIQVRIRDVRVSGQNKDYVYNVILIDP